MKITVEFDNLQEINDFCNGVLIAPGLAQTAREEAAQPVAEEPKKAEPKKATPKKEEAQEEAKTEAPAEPKAEKVDVTALRKMLAAVNKKTGTNTASTWIQETAGKEKLTEVTDQDALAQIKAKAEEELNG